MNRGEIQTATRHFLDEVGTDYVTGTIVVDSVKRAARKLNTDAGFYIGDVTIALQTSVREYTMSASILDIRRVRLGYGSSRVKLDPTSPQQLEDDYGDDWEAATSGTPTEYYTEGQLFGVHPKPHGTAAATAIYIRCVKEIPDLTNATASPSWLPARYHDTIAKGAAVDIAGGYLASYDNMPARLQKLYAEYLQEVRELQGLANKRSTEHIPQITVGHYGTFRR